MLWIAPAAAQLSAPEPIEIRTLFSPDDVPMQYLPVESDRTVGIRLTVRPDGHVQSCDAEYKSGIDGLDVYTCKLAKRRARFAPASGENGTPSYAVFRTSVRWVVTGFAKPGIGSTSADLALTVNQLPDGLTSPTIISLTFVVDELGRPSSCSHEVKAGQTQRLGQEYVRLACDQLLLSYKPKPAKDGQGRAVPSIQDAVVAFTIK